MFKKKAPPTPKKRDQGNHDDWTMFDGLDQVVDRFKGKYSSCGAFNNFAILPQLDVDFRAYVFLNTNSEITNAESIGLLDEMKDYVFELLEQAGRGLRSEISISFEIDSFENIQENYEGNYSFRLQG